MALAFSLFAFACNGNSEGSPATPTAPPPTPTATVEASPTPDVLGAPEANGERAFEHVRHLSVDIGPRLAGTEGEQETVEYLSDTLASYGYVVTIQDFSFDASAFLPARVDGGEAALGGYAFNGSAGGEATGPLVFVGLGRNDQLPPNGLAGRIALVERGEIEFGEKVRNAMDAGAEAVVIYNNADGSLLGDLNFSATIPAVGVRRDHRDALRALADAGADVTVRVSPPRGTAYNVIAKPPGIETCETVTGGHHDTVAVTGGADDNASGTAGVLEVARIAAADRLPGANCFVLFGAEEFGLFGSQAYVESLSEDERNRIRAMLNLDVIGTGEPLILLGIDDGMVETTRLAAVEIGVDAVRASIPNGSGSDHLSFERAGVPAVMFYRHNPNIHTPADNISIIEASSLEETIRVAYQTLRTLNVP